MSFDFDPETGVILSETDDELMPESPESPDELDGTDEHSSLADLGETVAQVEAEGLDFFLTASDVASLMTERLGRKTTTATFRRMVVKADAPAPAGTDGKTVKWSQNTIDTWLDRLEHAAREASEAADSDSSPDGRDFFLSAAEAAALVSEESGNKFTVAMFRRMVMDGIAPPAVLQAGGTSKWSQATLDAWIKDDLHTDPAPATVQEIATLDPVPAPESDEEAVPKHANVFEFFDETFSLLFELYDTDPAELQKNVPVMVWCQQWWLHKAVLGRVTAAWYAWEDSYASGGGAMSSWILEHADRHFDRIMAEEGPFRRCKGGHNRALKKYPTIAPLEPHEDPEQQAAEAFAQNTQREPVPHPAAGRGNLATGAGSDHQPPPPPRRVQAREY